MLRKIILLLAFTFSLLTSIAALEIDSCVDIILQKDTEHFTEATTSICETNDPNLLPLIAAIVENRLYTSNTTALTKIPGQDDYTPVYPTNASEVSNNTITPVKFSRRERQLFNPLKKHINLVHYKPEVRAIAYVPFIENGNVSDLKIFNTLKESETDPKVLEKLQNAIWGIQLRHGTSEEQLTTLDAIAESNADIMNNLLVAYAENQKVNSIQKTKADKIIKHIHRHESTVKMAQNLFSGISLGSILLLVALGLSIIYGLGGVINMSHGEFVMIGAYTAFCIQEIFVAHLPAAWLDMFFIVSIPFSFIVAGLFGLLIERTVIKHLYNKPLESMLATWGLSLILIQTSRSIFGDVTAVKAPSFLNGGIEVMAGLILPYNRLFIIGLTILMVILTYLVFNKSRLGLKIRSVTQNRNMSSCMGIHTGRIDSITFFLGSGLAGVAGCAMTLIGNVVPDMGQTFIVDSFLVVVTGGVGKLIGTIISAMGIGVLSKIFEFFFQAVYGKAIMLGIIIFFLQYKPKGLFPEKGRHSDDD